MLCCCRSIAVPANVLLLHVYFCACQCAAASHRHLSRRSLPHIVSCLLCLLLLCLLPVQVRGRQPSRTHQCTLARHSRRQLALRLLLPVRQLRPLWPSPLHLLPLTVLAPAGNRRLLLVRSSLRAAAGAQTAAQSATSCAVASGSGGSRHVPTLQSMYRTCACDRYSMLCFSFDSYTSPSSTFAAVLFLSQLHSPRTVRGVCAIASNVVVRLSTRFTSQRELPIAASFDPQSPQASCMH